MTIDSLLTLGIIIMENYRPLLSHEIAQLKAQGCQSGEWEKIFIAVITSYSIHYTKLYDIAPLLMVLPFPIIESLIITSCPIKLAVFMVQLLIKDAPFMSVFS